MKINPVSFKGTYLHPSIQHLSPENRQKLEYCYSIGVDNPYDIFLGGTALGDLTLAITRCSPYKYAVQNGVIEMDEKGIMQYNMATAFEEINEYIHGPKYPEMKSTISDLDSYDVFDLYLKILTEIYRYERTYKKKLNKYIS